MKVRAMLLSFSFRNVAFLISVFTAFALSGCLSGAGSSTAASGSSSTSGASSVVYAINKSAPIASCATGGITVQSGIDTNGNGTLDPSEVTSTQYVCNGASGTAALVAMTAETAGANCTSGGHSGTQYQRRPGETFANSAGTL